MLRCLLPLLLFALLISSAAQLPAQIRVQIQGGAIPIQLFNPRATSHLELTPAQIEQAPSTTVARLEQVDALITAEQWDEVIDTLLDLMDQREDGLLETSPNHFAALQEFAQIKLAQLPAEPLELYRQRVDGVAETWYRKAIQQNSPEQLRRLLSEMFCSSWGDDALWALGEMALEQGDTSTARRCWEQLSPFLRSPAGRPEWIALTDIDLDVHWAEVQRSWQQRTTPHDWLAYPDTDLDLAQVRARLVLVSIREDNLERAQQEIAILKKRHETLEGHIGGRKQAIFPALQQMLNSANNWQQGFDDSSWSTTAGSFSRNGGSRTAPGVLWPAWQSPVPFYSGTAVVRRNARAHSKSKLLPLRYNPLIIGDHAFYNGSRQIKAIELATGKPAITPKGILFTAPRAKATGTRISGIPVAGTARYTMTEYNGVIYARVGTPTTYRTHQGNVGANQESDQLLVGIDLQRQGLLTFRAEPDDHSWSFEGAPVCKGNHLFIAMRHSDIKPQACLACFDLATGERLWRKPICSADTLASIRSDEITHGMLTLAGDTLFYNTNLGTVVALSTDRGTFRWLTRYERTGGNDLRDSSRPKRELSPCLNASGLVFVAPNDSTQLLALDASTGKIIWTIDDAADVDHFLGTRGEKLIASGHRLLGIDMRTGRIDYAWPVSNTASIRGRGRGCLLGRDVFWPTQERICIIDARTGAQSRPPIDIRKYSSGGANVVSAKGYVLLATPERLMAFGPSKPDSPPPPPDNDNREATVAIRE